MEFFRLFCALFEVIPDDCLLLYQSHTFDAFHFDPCLEWYGLQTHFYLIGNHSKVGTWFFISGFYVT